MLPPPSDAVTTEDVQLPDGGPRVRVYKPKQGGEDLPIGLYIRSGGWMAGSIEGEDHLARNIAERVPMVLVSTSYRLAPENPFLAGLHDCIAAYKWTHANRPNLSTTTTNPIIMGGPSGANLTCAVALSLANDEALKPQGLILACPFAIEPSCLPEEYQEWWHPERYLDAAMLDRKAMGPCVDAYNAPPTKPLWSILLPPSLSTLPPTYLAACTKDPTYDETCILHDRLEKLGNDSALAVWEGYPHFFWVLPMLGKSGEFMAGWAEEVRRLVG
ncbi:alpha/beta-hydrolase [Glonium stellatum]|uniref:Alpha/beta-hydrolase n=1 Tax=Glonium stellatum TaxID=574774 RepID=A0A8E2EZH8_9PEZI|nr:alpha/beta-hydrolase [Glonium stellatum]